MSLPEGYKIVELAEKHHQSSLSVLSQLTTVGDVSMAQFEEFLKLQGPGHGYYTKVIENEQGNLVGIATLLIERKLIHGASKVGHIEDVAIDTSQRGKGLGKILVKHLCQYAVENGCYKVILDCSEENVGFYEHCDLKRAGVEMDYRP